MYPFVLAQTQGPLDNPTGEIADATKNLIESLLQALPRVGIAVAIVIIGYLVSRLTRWGLNKVFSRNQTPSFARVMSKLAGWTVLGVAVLMALTAVFPSVKPVDLLAGLGFFSVAVGFAFQDILENTLSGVLLLFRQPFQSGDQIMVQDEAGTVEAITIRETRLKTFDGKLVVIPNRDVYKNAIIVQTHYDQRRLSFMVGAAYENDAAEACGVVVNTLRSVEGVAEDPAPEALISQLGVSTVDIEARFWADPRQHEARVLTDRAIKAVKVALEEAGIEMPADIVALQATPSFRAAIQGDSDVTPGGGLKTA
ncbi:MAG: mechanosensitive ion channel family protein [Acidimicrobiia bacterium]|nr:mechanosensitive ion channel family protein [Acidimicrobiia bacterium]NNF65030.1 mechanosensitive ion channel family protein [Acidimicrobiia bacterium]